MLKVILADNQSIFRAGAAKVLAVEDDIRVVAQAQNGEQTLAAIARFRASVAICAAGLIEDLSALLKSAAEVRTHVVLVADKNTDADALLKQGVRGVLYRSVSGTELVECVRKVTQGGTWTQHTDSPEEEEDDFVGARVRDRLTPKELRIVALIVQGFKNKEIAQRLGTTEQVIKNYLRNVYDKIGVSDRLELALFTIHHRILADAAAASVSAEAGR